MPTASSFHMRSYAVAHLLYGRSMILASANVDVSFESVDIAVRCRQVGAGGLPETLAYLTLDTLGLTMITYLHRLNLKAERTQ